MNKNTRLTSLGLMLSLVLFSPISLAEEEMLVDQADGFDFESFHDDKPSNKPGLLQRLTGNDDDFDTQLQTAQHPLSSLNQAQLQTAQLKLYQQMLKQCPQGFVKTAEQLSRKQDKTLSLSYEYICEPRSSLKKKK